MPLALEKRLQMIIPSGKTPCLPGLRHSGLEFGDHGKGRFRGGRKRQRTKERLYGGHRGYTTLGVLCVPLWNRSLLTLATTRFWGSMRTGCPFLFAAAACLS